MLKKTFLLLSIPLAAFYVKAQDVSIITNTAEVYSGNNFNGTAKYNAMAGSLGALGGDISSVSVNPAGLGLFITNDVNLTLGIFNNKNKTSLAGQSLNYSINKADVSNAGGVLSINLNDTSSNWKFINIGVNYSYQSLENYSEAPGNNNIKIVKNNFADEQGNQISGTLAYTGHAYDRYGDISHMNFAVGANYNNRLYFGAGLNFRNAAIHQYESASFDVSAGSQNFSTNMDKQYTPYDELSQGFSANFGVIAKINNQIRLGASVETPTWWSIERSYSYYETSNTTGNTLSGYFGEDRKLTTPMKATLSAAIVPSKNFSFNIDYIQGLTKPKYKVYGDAETELNDFFSDSYKNVSEFRAGAEYRLAGLRLRAGYTLQGNSFDNVSFLGYNDNGSTSINNYSNLFVSKRNIFGAGIGYDFQAFYVDATYQNISTEYKSPFLQGSSAYNTGYYNGNFDVTSDAYAVSNVKNSRNNFFVTVGWKF